MPSGPSRRTALAAISSAGVASLAGCAGVIGQAPTRNGTVVQLAANSNAASSQGKINEALHAAGLSKDITLEILAMNSGRARQQFSQWLTAGLDRPDLLRTDSGWTVPLIVRDQLANLSETLPDLANRVREEYFDASVATATGPDGDVYGVPLFSDFGLMLYRKDLVQTAGFDPSNWATNPLSWQRFAEVTKQTKKQAGTTYGTTFQAAIYEGLSCCTFNEWTTSMGGSYFGPRKNLLQNVGDRPVTVDADPTVNAVKLVRSFLYGPEAEGTLEGVPGPIAPQSVLQWEEDSSLAAFMNGDAVTHRNWPYSVLAAGAKDAFGEKLGVMPMPFGVTESEAKFAGMGGSNSALGGWHVALNPHSKRTEAATEVLRAMSQDRFYLAMMAEMGYVPPKPTLLESSQARDVEVMGRYVDTLKYAGQHAIPRPVTVAWPMQSPRIAQQVSAAFSGQKSPTQAMSDLQSLLVEIENSVVEEVP